MSAQEYSSCEEMTIGGPTRSGHIHVGNYRSCGFSGRGTPFPGLDQASFPGPILQDHHPDRASGWAGTPPQPRTDRQTFTPWPISSHH
jgi:hypothetical protein